MVEVRWLSAAEIADYLGVRKDTVYEWIERRGMPAHRIGRIWRFQAPEVDQWVRDGKAGEPSSNREDA